MSFRSPQTDINWSQFNIRPQDLEFLSAHLLDIETPLSPVELAGQLIRERLRVESAAQAKQAAETKTYRPMERYAEGDQLLFPAQEWITGRVSAVRQAQVLNGGGFDVLTVVLEDGSAREYAAGLAEHALNAVETQEKESPEKMSDAIAKEHAHEIAPQVTAALRESPDFVYIAGRWFPKALIVDVGEGQLNVAEALLDMASGGPLPTSQLLGEVDLAHGVNPKLAEFSLDMALQNDPRFDEVGPAGEVAWFLHRLEPEAVRNIPLFLRQSAVETDRTALSDEMLELERRIEDELTPADIQPEGEGKDIQVPLLFPHWRAGGLPLTKRMARFFPTAYESPRVRFDFVDAQNDERFQGWVVRQNGYVVGLRDWYERRGLMPGSYVRIRRGEKPGEVQVSTEAHRSSKEWVRTALVGADGGVVYAMLKQQVDSSFDERMMIYLPGEPATLEAIWQKRAGQPVNNFAQIVTNTMRDLAKLTTQNHVHAVELYSALNLVLRCPPGQLFALLSSRPQFQHVGHLHFRLVEQVA
jgi:hypothetical protein